MRCNKISAFYLYYKHPTLKNKILKGFIFGNIDFICTFEETKTHRGITRQRYENKRERFIKTIGDR